MTDPGRLNEGINQYNRANELRDRQKYGESLTCYGLALDMLVQAAEPLRICLFYDLAICHDFTGDAEAAALWFGKTIQLFEDQSTPAAAAAVEHLRSLIEGCRWQLNFMRGRNPQDADYYNDIVPQRFHALDMPLKLYIDSSESTGFDDGLRQDITSAFSLWTEGLPALGFVTPDQNPLSFQPWDIPVGANIRVHRSDGINRALPPSSGGQTTFERSENFRSAHIWTYLAHHDRDGLNPNQLRAFQSLIVHEAGHALGLDGHSPFGTDLMYWKSALMAPRPRDLKTLYLVYSAG